jgi:hypothetical protein
MAYQFNRTGGQYLNCSSAPATAAPLTIACWFNFENITENGALVVLNNSNGLDSFNLQALGAVTGDPIQAGATVNLSTGFARTTAGYAANTWNHAAGVFTSATSRTAYLNAGNAATNTISRTPTVNELNIGVINNNGLVNYMRGLIAEVGIWNAALTAAEIASLAKGMTCDKVRPESLVFYAPLVRDLNDQKGGLTITNNNGATVASHPRVYA